MTEALALMDKIQLVMTGKHGARTTVHVAVQDPGGNSSIIEYIGGEPMIHHGRDYRIMTNDPPYDEQLELAGAYHFSQPTSDTPLPGNVNPRDRFARATYFLQIMPAPKTERESVAPMFAIARNVSVPFGAPYKGFGIYNTAYRSVADDTNRRYFFELTTSPNVIWVALDKFDLQAGAPVMVLHPDAADLSGNVTSRFERVAAPY